MMQNFAAAQPTNTCGVSASSGTISKFPEITSVLTVWRRVGYRVMVTLEDVEEVGTSLSTPMSFLTYDVKRSIVARIGLRRGRGEGWGRHA